MLLARVERRARKGEREALGRAEGKLVVLLLRGDGGPDALEAHLDVENVAPLLVAIDREESPVKVCGCVVVSRQALCRAGRLSKDVSHAPPT